MTGKAHIIFDMPWLMMGTLTGNRISYGRNCATHDGDRNVSNTGRSKVGNRLLWYIDVLS